MSILDYIILALVAAALIFAWRIYRRKGSCSCGGCSGCDCKSCAQCNSANANTKHNG